MAHFRLPPGLVWVAVRQHSVEEIWYFIYGGGELWRRGGSDDAVVVLKPGLCITIPCGHRIPVPRRGRRPAVRAWEHDAAVALSRSPRFHPLGESTVC
ncbi:MAG TPA: hypothetical protein VET24_01255 [Actinomycetota bacterium]|nr:hypothetical protein [Actinomycetota bacterium]